MNVGSNITPILKAKGLVKRFSGTIAVNGVDLELFAGQVLAVVGENGAGKSTLKNLLIGYLLPDEGTIELEGMPISRFNAVQLGIAAVHQEFSLFPNLSVAENICIADLPSKHGVINWKEAHKIAKRYLELIGAEIDLDISVEKLTTGEQQLIEIAKALRQAKKILILDEPTTSLTNPEREKLFGVIRRLQERGLGIIYISHFIDEVYEISDKVVVLRDGHYVGGGLTSNLPRRQLEELMVGRATEQTGLDRGTPNSEVVLRVDRVYSGGKVKGISLKLHKGEILGICGLMGAGRTELAEAIFGLRESTGKIQIRGKVVNTPTPDRLRKLGVAFVPEDRRQNGLFVIRSLRENLTISALDRLVQRIIPGIGFKGEKQNAIEIAQSMNVVYSNIEKAIRFLSGGNQQKALLGRWLAIQPEICILDEPTRGVDIGAKREIHRLICDLARQGTSILLISSDLSEVISLSHRILVIRKGRIVHELRQSEFDPVILIKYMASNAKTEIDHEDQ